MLELNGIPQHLDITSLKLSDICWLAWHALERTKQTAKSFDEWLENVEMVSLSNEPDPVPLESKANTGQ